MQIKVLLYIIILAGCFISPAKRSKLSEINIIYFIVTDKTDTQFGSNRIPVDWNKLELSFDMLHSPVLDRNTTEMSFPLQESCNT